MEQQRDSGYYEPLAILFCVQVNDNNLIADNEKKILFRYPFKSVPESGFGNVSNLSSKTQSKNLSLNGSRGYPRASLPSYHNYRENIKNRSSLLGFHLCQN